MITLTEAAVIHIKTQLATRNSKWGIYVGVVEGGCSGMSYDICFFDQPQAENVPDDIELVVISSINIAYKKDQLAFFDGMDIDFVEHGLNSGLEFNNPNVTSECGCGVTFTTK